MARYILTACVVGQPTGYGYSKYPRGTTIADTVGNAQAGDLVWPGLTAFPSPVNMLPLDAAASAIMNLPITTLAALAANPAGGVGDNVGS